MASNLETVSTSWRHHAWKPNHPHQDKKEYCIGTQLIFLTHWGRETHICVSDLIIIGSDNGLSPGRRRDIIRTNAGILLIRPLGTNFSEILIKILVFSFKKMRLKASSAKRRPFCIGLNVSNQYASFPTFSSSLMVNGVLWHLWVWGMPNYK